MEKIELQKIISVSGKPGIYKVLASGKGAIIAESLVDGKRLPIHPTEKISSLSDISMFTHEDDVPLREVLTKMKDHYATVECPDSKSEKKILRGEMLKFMPTYDADRVHDSDLRKLFSWFTILKSKDMLEFAVEEEEEKGVESTEPES